jgi:S-adenosylmethionine hydrolase
MHPPRPIITLLTDFGTRDAYVGSMKGVILELNVAAVLVDLSHEVPPQDILAGAFILAEAAPYFPPGTIHLAVVDPGVGTGRRALAVRGRGQYWVGPDNGLLHLAIAKSTDLTIVSLENPAYFRPEVSATFHGRDIYAPVAAHLSLGVDLSQFGHLITDPVPLPCPVPLLTSEKIRGEIIYVDRFGNLISNLPAQALKTWLQGRALYLRLGYPKDTGRGYETFRVVKDIILGKIAQTYADMPPGKFLALEGSHGYLEIACNQDSAARRLAMGVGAVLEIRKE